MDNSNQSLEQLVNDYKAGSEEAAAQLVSTFSHQMAVIASRIARRHHSPSAVDVEGVVNSGFRSFFSAINKPDFETRGGKVGGLLATIVSRKALLRIRKLSRQPQTIQSDTEVLDFLALCVDDKSIPAELEGDLGELLEPILLDLTIKERALAVAILDPFEDRSLEELAKSNQTSLVTVEELWRTIQAKLKAKLKRN